MPVVDALIESAPAKINLFLHVLARRADGFHALDSLVVFAAIGDELRLSPGEEVSLEVSGPFAGALCAAADNLVMRAAQLALDAHAGAFAGKFSLTKILPIASGMGGGSSDAAAALRLLRARNSGLTMETLAHVAARLGADIPACLAARPVWLEGTGARVSPGPRLPSLPAVLVNPGVSIATPEVFARLGLGLGENAAARRPVERPAALADIDAVCAYLADTGNDLEKPACEAAPEIAWAKRALGKCDGCMLARMTGSGASVFGLFRNADAAAKAAESLMASYPAWWITATTLNAPK